MREVLEYAAARPVHVGAIFKDDVHERVIEEGIATYDLGERHREHLGGEGIGDLIFDDARGLAGILGKDDDLHIGQIGDGIERDLADRINSTEDNDGHQHQDEELILYGKFNDATDHDYSSISMRIQFDMVDSYFSGCAAFQWASAWLPCLTSVVGTKVILHLGHFPG